MAVTRTKESSCTCQCKSFGEASCCEQNFDGIRSSCGKKGAVDDEGDSVETSENILVVAPHHIL